VEANSTGGQGSRRAVAPSDDDDDLRLTEENMFLTSRLSSNSVLNSVCSRHSMLRTHSDIPRSDTYKRPYFNVSDPKKKDLQLCTK
jgi:hypothetical protein